MKDGSKIGFWHNIWCGDQPLKIVFLAWYGIFCCKEVPVAEILHFSANMEYYLY